jgi:hypothetical protein
VIHRSLQPPICSRTLRRTRPIVPPKMIEFRWSREGIEASKKYRYASRHAVK